MTISQKRYLDHEDTNTYHDDITITDVPKDEFLAITHKATPREGESTRRIQIELLPLEQAPGGTRTAGLGLFVRKEGKTSIEVTVLRGRTVVAENTTSYPG